MPVAWLNFKPWTSNLWMQVLQRHHASLFQLLGKTSARDVDKLQAVRDAGFSLTERYGFATFSGVCKEQ